MLNVQRIIFSVAIVGLASSLSGMQKLASAMNYGHGAPCLLAGFVSYRFADIFYHHNKEMCGVDDESDTSRYDKVKRLAYIGSAFNAASALCNATTLSCIHWGITSFLRKKPMAAHQALQSLRFSGAVAAGCLSFVYLLQAGFFGVLLCGQAEERQTTVSDYVGTVSDMAAHVGAACLCGLGAAKLATNYYRGWNR